MKSRECDISKLRFDNAMLGLRLGDKPRLLVSTTPRPTAFMKKLVATAGISITATRFSREVGFA